MSGTRNGDQIMDLRKLTLRDLDTMLSKAGVSDEEIKTLTRWQKVALVRELMHQCE